MCFGYSDVSDIMLLKEARRSFSSGCSIFHSNVVQLFFTNYYIDKVNVLPL